MTVLGFYSSQLEVSMSQECSELRNISFKDIFLLSVIFYQPASVDNNLNLFFFDEIEIRVEHLVSLNAGNLLNLVTIC